MIIMEDQYHWVYVGSANIVGEATSIDLAVERWTSLLWGKRVTKIIGPNSFDMDGTIYSVSIDHEKNLWIFMRRCLKMPPDTRFVPFVKKDLQPEKDV